MDFTGERFVPGVNGNIELEHLHRYVIACEIVAGKEVLDIASGEGYGAAMLAGKAAEVVGVDIDATAIAHARARYPHDNLQFLAGSCTEIPLTDASIDLVVSFETIEHHDQHEKMMREVKRVLRPGGALLISSPDKQQYSGNTAAGNPYHVKELNEHEFKQLLSRHFKNCAYYGQRMVYGSGIFAESLATHIAGYSRDNEAIAQAAGIARPMYWLAVASDASLPAITSGVFERAATSHLVEVVLAGHEAKIADLERTIEEIRRSNSWRLTAPLRALKRWFGR